MALTSWKSLRFFDASQVQLPDGDASKLEGSVSCIASGPSHVFVGTPDGTLRFLDRSFKTTLLFKAHDTGRISNIEQIPDTLYLATLAEDLSSEPTLKIWALDKPDKKTGIPRCLCTVAVQNGRKQFPVTAFAFLQDLSQVAVGFGNGSVTIIRGDFIHDRGTKQRTVLETDEPITGLEFREGNVTSLYIATTNRVSTLAISGRGQGQPARNLDEHGCAVGCMTKDSQTGDIVVARDDAVYLYGPRGRGASYAYEGVKKMARMHKDYVMLVSPPQTNSLTRSAPLRAFSTTQADELFNTSSFTILNHELKLIAYSEALSSPVNMLFSAWGDPFILTLDGKLFRYREKSFQQKLDILYQRDLFVLAINLAQKEGVDVVQQNVIFRRYGDYLYLKGDYDTAMQQYLRAIDNTEPSQIIRKFLDNQRIRNLIEYLEELHEHHKASSDHTTLLLNCYAKLKDVEKLEAFIKSPGDLRFDLDTAITMCRQGGYSDQAAYLARKHDEHGLVVDILIEDLKKYAEALAYIWRLEPSLAYESAMKYGTVLLEHEPKDMTQFFIDYFTGIFRLKKDAVVVQEEAPVDQPGYGRMATTAVQNLAALIPLPYMSTDTVQKTTAAPQVIESTVEDEYVEYTTPKPRIAFAAFVDHPDQFITFLEALIKSDGLKEEDRAVLYTTLFEMYLQLAKNKSSGVKQEWESKAKQLVEQHNALMGTSNILLLSHLTDFKDGTTLVREQRGLYFDIFRSYASANDTMGAIRALRKYGPEAPQLYPTALAYLTSSPKVLEEAGSEVDVVLKRIDDDGLMAPLQVIQTLSQSKVATMGLVKSYLSKTIERERSEIAANRRLISSYRSDTATKSRDIEDLNTKPTSFSATRCSSCGTPLDLPTVHFMCKHSFHERCLNIGAGGEDEDDVDCPICAPQNATIKTIKRAQEESADRHDLFLDALARSSDKFGTVSEWFGRGVMQAGTAAAE